MMFQIKSQFISGSFFVILKRPFSLIILFVLFAATHLFGQINYESSKPFPDLPLAPEASAFAKYGDVPVNYSTGVTNIEIPIFTLQLKDYTLPIGLSYHSGGFKVDEMATDIGLGWTLNCIGTISQTVKGLRDELNGTSGYLTKQEILTLLDEDNNRNLTDNIGTYLVAEPESSQFSQTNQKPTNQDNIFFGYKDAEPDMFNFNFPGSNGKFFQGIDGNFYTTRHSKLDIKYFVTSTEEGGDPVHGFVIKDENGISYTFDVSERLDIIPSCNSSSIHMTSRKTESFDQNFYLSKICLPTGGCISFEYIEYSYSYTASISQTQYSKISAQGRNKNGDPSLCSTKINIISGKKIKKITSDNAFQIEFNYNDTQRWDLPDALEGKKSGKLDQIIVKHSGQIIKNIEFRHDYTIGYSNAYLVNSGIESSDIGAANRRLMLREIQETGTPPHKFEYMSDPNWGNKSLPSRFSYNKDFWGYYNGEVENQSLIPFGETMGVTMGNANRLPNVNFMQANLLKKIVYPTGGFSEFTYEEHQRHLNPSVEEENGCFYETEAKEVSIISEGDQGPQSKFFSVTANSSNLRAFFSTNSDQSTQLQPVADQPFSQALIVDEVVFGTNDTGFLNLTLGSGTYEMRVWTAGYTDEIDENQNPIPVRTELRVSWDERKLKCPTNNDNTIKLSYSGLRIKEVVTSDLPNDHENYKPLIKTYEYRSPRFNNDMYSFTNGIYQPNLLNFLSYSYEPFDAIHAICSEGSEPYFGGPANLYAQYICRSSDPAIPLSFSSGGALVYDEVIEYHGEQLPILQDANNSTSHNVDFPEQHINGKKHFHFENFDNPKRFSESIYAEEDISWLNGNLLKIEEYKFVSINDTQYSYQLVKKTEHTYTLSTLQGSVSPTSPVIWGLKVSRIHSPFLKNDEFSSVDGNTQCVAVVPRYAAVFYGLSIRWRKLESTIEYMYQSPALALSNETKYTYNSKTLRPLSIRRTSNPKADYATYEIAIVDLKASSTLFEEMSNKNIISWPVLKVSTFTRKLTPDETDNPLASNAEFIQQIERYDYSKIGTNYLLDKVATKTFSDAPSFNFEAMYSTSYFDSFIEGEAREIDFKYNFFGNIIEVNDNNITQSYIWDHTNSVIVCHALRATNKDVYYEGFELEGDTGESKSGKKFYAGGTFIIEDISFQPPTYQNLKISYWYFEDNTWKFSGELPFPANRTIHHPGTKLDEVRVFPDGAQLITYTHIPGIGVSCITDTNGNSTFYEYEHGRLKAIYDDRRNLVQKVEYKYQSN